MGLRQVVLSRMKPHNDNSGAGTCPADLPGSSQRYLLTPRKSKSLVLAASREYNHSNV
jgi:hypothetical protein